MKELQTPLKQRSQSSPVANRRSRDGQTKKQTKFSKKNLSSVFASSDGDDVLPNILEESFDMSNITAISEAKCDDDLLESFALSESSTPCSKGSTVTMDDQISDSKASNPVEVEFSFRCLREAQSQLRNSLDLDTSSKKLLDAVIKVVIEEMHPLPDETDWVLELVSRKARVVCCCFLLWILVIFTVLFFGSANDSSYTGLVLT